MSNWNEKRVGDKGCSMQHRDGTERKMLAKTGVKRFLSKKPNKRVNTANETTIHNLHNKVEELMKKLGDTEWSLNYFQKANNDLTRENVETSSKVICMNDELFHLTQENDILRGDLEVEKSRSSQWKEDNKLLTESIRQKQERIEQQEMELVGLRGLLSEPKEKIILDKKLFGFNVVISKGEK